MPNAAKLVRKFTAWGFSRWSEWEECPFRAASKHIDKVKEPERDVTSKGTDAHADAYAWLQGNKKQLLGNLVTFEEEFKELKRSKPLIEQQWAFTSQWKPCGWFDSVAWLRVMVDLHFYDAKLKTVYIDDIKTGKIYEEKGKLQLDLYGLAGFLMYPDAQTVVARMDYIDQAKAMPLIFERKDLKKMQTAWLGRIRGMFADRKFIARPGRQCTWCHLSKTKGGPCPKA